MGGFFELTDEVFFADVFDDSGTTTGNDEATRDELVAWMLGDVVLLAGNE